MEATPRPVFSILSALVEERAGLHYGPADQEIFLDKVRSRAVDAGFDSLLDYYYFLRYDAGGPRELEALIEALVVNETFFFRELAPLRLLVDEMLLPIVREGRTPRVWCAASATGEEPLTLAMLLAEADVLSKVEIVASDISARVIERAKSGRFGRRSLRDVPEPAIARRWLQEEAGHVTVDPALVRAITWKRINLCDPDACRELGAFDVILCRNVLIYFRDETTVRVIEALSDRLKAGGVLFVGVSESLLRFGTLLACEENRQVFYYRRLT